jgi:hypothetical protein
MPIGAQMQVQGTLERGPFGYVVRSGTGKTQIGCPRDASKLVGRQVEVEGWRIAFDKIACDRIWQCGERPPNSSTWPGFDIVIIGALTIYGLAASLAHLIG